MNRTLPVVAFALLMVPAFARAASAKVEVGDAAHGERIFRVHCGACHGTSGRGDGAVKTVPAPADLVDPSRMNLLSEAQLYRLVEHGGEAMGRSVAMPAFGGALDPLEMWDVVAYLRSRHLALADFFPDAAAYFADVYTIDDWGVQRHKELTGRALSQDDRSYTVLGVYKGTQRPEGPRMIPNTPLEISKINRRDKVGYVVFVDGELPGIPGRHVLGVGMDVRGLVWGIKANVTDAALRSKIESQLAPWEGYGNKGMKEPFPVFGSAQERAVSKAWTEIYSRAMEAVVMFDKAERDRHWADADFGGDADPEVSVEGGELEVNQNRKGR